VRCVYLREVLAYISFFGTEEALLFDEVRRKGGVAPLLDPQV
jgi:hypothetical protein